MITQRRFRILTPAGKLSADTFVLPPEQPRNINAGCTLLIHQRSGTRVTVCDARLFPAEAAVEIPVAGVPISVCLRYDRLQGVVQVRLSFRERGGALRGMLTPAETPPATSTPTLAPLMDYRRNLVGQ
jgi:hypothetical protein